MQKPNRILAPIDFSPASEAAAGYAGALAKRYAGECTLLHVLPPLEFSFAMASPPPARKQELTAGRREAACQALERIQVSFPVHRELQEGDPAEMIVAAASQGRFDTVVMPTRGAGAIRRWLLIGSVTAKVLSTTECPVWTGVHWPSFSGGLAIPNIVCALDLRKHGDTVLCYAWTLAREFDARLTVVHAMPPAGEAAEDFFDETWRMTLRARITDRIRQLLDAASAEAEIVVETGKPAAAVAQAARQRRAGLVVLGRSEASGVLSRLRANAYEIVRLAPCPAVAV